MPVRPAKPQAAFQGPSQRVYYEPITKTVGHNQDFELLHDAILWASKQVTTGSGNIQLHLSDQTHYVEKWYTIACRVTIYGNSTAACIVSAKNVSDLVLFQTILPGDLIVRDLTLDLDGGNADITWFLCHATMELSDVEIVDGKHGLHIDGGHSSATITASSEDTTWAVTGSQLASSQGSIVVLTFSGTITFTGGNPALFCHRGGRLLFTGVLSGNTTDTNIPLNEIQYDGSYITDGTAALSFKA